MTGSSVNFKTVKMAGHAVSHASRAVAPSYLLPPDKSLGTIVLLDDKGNVASTLANKLGLASPRAKVDKNFSPVWEGILNLPRPEAGFDSHEYKKNCVTIVSNWCKKYEAMTGHKILRTDIHLDEGHIADGEALLNAHAHIIADRTNNLGRVIKLSPKQLRELQTVTAEVTGLQRGENSRKSGRKHIDHHAYRYLAESGRLESQKQIDRLKKDLAHVRNLYMKDSPLISELREEIKTLKSEATDLREYVKKLELDSEKKKEEYRLEREALKASGKATQQDYQQLKKDYEAALAVRENEQKATKPIKPIDVFMDAHRGINVVNLRVIDGARLDAFEGRWGLFSWPNKTTGVRNQVLCEVPDNKVMPSIGQCYDSRAVTDKNWGIGR